jgi:cell wall-associated NlpC family hydrolase
VNARITRARHRAARRPLAPLSVLAQSVTNSSTGRRAAVVATAGGLLVSTFGTASAAQAAPVQDDAANQLDSVGIGAIADQAREALETAPVVTVAADARLSVEKVKLKVAADAITPAPEPEPEPEPVVAAVATATKSTGSSTTASSSDSTSSSTSSDTTSTSSSSGSTAVSSSSRGSEIVSIASRYIGTPYVVGGATPAGFDCSGLVTYVYAQVGISLPHSSSAIRSASNVTVISRAEAQPGDLIWSPGHIAIYIGGDQQIDASRPDGWDTRIRSIWQSAPVFLRVTG